MQEIRQAIEDDDSEKVLQIFSRAKSARDNLIAERENVKTSDSPD
jgi:hypothetical protein